MILIDKMLDERQRQANPIRVALVGAGFSGRNIAYQVINSFPGLRLVAISNRTIAKAREAYSVAGVVDVQAVKSPTALDQAIRENRYAITDNPSVACAARNVDAVIESTGTVDFGASVVLKSIKAGKHIILMNAELDATLGPILKVYADRAGVVYTNSDGDEPGVAMNMIRFVKAIGLKALVAGNLKGLYDPYRNPDTQRAFAERISQQPQKIASFADGTKLSMELTVLANATGFKVGRRGMYGPALAHVNDSCQFFRDKLMGAGLVDFLVGAEPGSGAFVLGYTEDPVKSAYLKYLKMGDGPLYAFYTPFHLPQLEIPLTVAKAVLLKEETVAPIGEPICDAIAFAKRDLKAGDVIDGMGGFACYTLVDNYEVSRNENALPMGVARGCRLIRNIKRDHVVTYSDVELPEDRLCDKLRHEQHDLFFK